MLYFMALALTLGLGVPLAVLGAATGQGKAAAAALDSMARQPEMSGKLQTVMILSLAFIESLVIFALLVFFLMNANLPDKTEMMKAVTTAAAVGPRWIAVTCDASCSTRYPTAPSSGDARSRPSTHSATAAMS